MYKIWTFKLDLLLQVAPNISINVLRLLVLGYLKLANKPNIDTKPLFRLVFL